MKSSPIDIALNREILPNHHAERNVYVQLLHIRAH